MEGFILEILNEEVEGSVWNKGDPNKLDTHLDWKKRSTLI